MTAANTFGLCVSIVTAISGIAMVLQSTFKPFSSFGLFKSSIGFDFTETANKDNQTKNAFKKLLSFQASVLLGSNGMTFFLGWMAFHDSVALAWWALWYWPIMFFWHSIIYKKGSFMWYLQIFFIVLHITMLLITKNVAFPS